MAVRPLSRQTSAARITLFASLAVVVLALHWARDLVVPLVLAGLIASILAPVCSMISERLRISRPLAVLLVAVLGSLVVTAVAWVAAVQIIAVAETLPQYRQNIRAKFADSGLRRLGQKLEGLSSVQAEITGGGDAETAPGGAPAGPEPMPVRVVEPSGGGLGLVSALAVGTLTPLAMAGLVAVITFFLLLRWDDARDRVIRLVSRGRITLTTKALDDLSKTLSKVLRLQFAVNAGTGVAAGLGLWAMGVPNALLWGVLAALLRYIPYIGPVIAAGLPALLAVATGDGWNLPLAILALYLAIEVVAGNFVEPYVYGASSGVSTLAMMVSFAFWTWLWGVPGLLLAAPITVGLAVVGRHVPQLAFLEVLLGDRPVLSPSARLYQRLVAADREDAARMTRAYQEEHGFARLCDDLLLPALRQAEEDAHEELLDETRIGGVYEGLFEIVEEAALRDAEAAKTEAAAPGPTAAALAGAVVCIPARDDADVIAAMMLTALLRRAGHDARSLTLANLGEDMGSLLGEAAPRAVCISAVPPFAARSARIRRRQVELRAPGVPVLTGLWIGDRAETTPTEPTADPDGTGRARRESVITSFSEMVSRVTAIRTPENPAPEEGGATPPEPAKLGGGTGEGPAEIDSPRGEARLA